MMMREYIPDHPCDRCEHPLSFHASSQNGSECRLAEGKVYPELFMHKRPRATKCWCDGYVPHE